MGNTNENFRYDETDDFLMQDAVLDRGVHKNRSDNMSPTIPRGDFVPINRSLSPPANERGYWARNSAVSPGFALKSGGFATEGPPRSVSPTSKKGFWANDGWQETNKTILAKIGGGSNSGINSSGFSVNNGGMQGGNYSSNAMASSGGRGVNMSTGNFSTRNSGVSMNGGGFSSTNNGVSINGGGYSTGNEGISLNGGNTSMITSSRSIGNTSLRGPNINAGANGISMQSESYQTNTGGIQGGVGNFSIGGGGNETMHAESNRRVTFATNDNGISSHHFVDQPGGVQFVEETTRTQGGGMHSNVPFGIERMFTEQDSYVGRSREGTGVSLGQTIATRAVVHPEPQSEYTVTETVHTEHKDDNKSEIIVHAQQPWQEKVGEWKTTSVTSSPRIERPGMSYDLWEMEPQSEFQQTHRSEITETSYEEPITSNAYTVDNTISNTPRAVKTTTTKSITRHRSEDDLVLPLDDVESYETETREVVVHKPVQQIKEFIQPPETRTIVKQTVVTETPRIEPQYVEYKPPSPPPPPKQFIVKQPPKVETHYIEYETTPPPIQRIVVKKPPRVETRYVEYNEPPKKEIIVRKPNLSPPPVRREINYVEYNKTPRQSEVSYEYHAVKPRYNSPPKSRIIVEEHVKKYVPERRTELHVIHKTKPKPEPKPEIRTTYNVVSDYLAPTKASSLKSLHRVTAENHKTDLPPLQAGRTSKRSSTTIDRTIQRGSYDIVKPRKTSSLDEVRYG